MGKEAIQTYVPQPPINSSTWGSLTRYLNHCIYLSFSIGKGATLHNFEGGIAKATVTEEWNGRVVLASGK